MASVNCGHGGPVGTTLDSKGVGIESEPSRDRWGLLSEPSSLKCQGNDLNHKHPSKGYAKLKHDQDRELGRKGVHGGMSMNTTIMRVEVPS